MGQGKEGALLPKARAGEAEVADPAPGHSQGVIITNILSVALHTYVLP